MSTKKAKRRAKAPTLETIKRILNSKNPPRTLAPYERIATYFGVPLWVMMIPNLPPEALENEPLAKLVKHVNDYVASGMEEPKPPERAALHEAHFCLNEPAVYIAGTPRPFPCPWCGPAHLDDITLVLGEPDSEGHRTAHVECTACGAEGPGAYDGPEARKDSQELVVEAARLWNDGPPELVIARGELIGAK